MDTKKYSILIQKEGGHAREVTKRKLLKERSTYCDIYVRVDEKVVEKYLKEKKEIGEEREENDE